MFPTKLKYYLEKAEKKGNKKNISITFSKLEQKADVFYSVVKQFSNESKKQGFGHEQLVQNAIREADMDKVKEISASVVGAANKYEFLKRLGTGDVSFYAKVEGTPFSIPLEWHEGSVYYMLTQVDEDICIGDKKYYDFYKVSSNSDGEITIILSDNIQIDIGKCKFIFKPKTDIKTLKHDAEFLMSAMKSTEINIGGHLFPYEDPYMPEELYKNLKFYIDLDKIFTQIGFEYSKPFSEIAESTKKKFVDIISLQAGRKNNLFTEKVHAYNLMVDEKYIPLIVFKNDTGGENEIFNAIYTEKYQMFVADEKENHYRVPMFAHIEGEIMKQLYKYDVEILERQIADAEINEVTEESMNMSGLNLIHAYDGDIEKNQYLLKIAERLFESLIDKFGKKHIYIINRMQIRKRMGELNKEELDVLSKMKCVDCQEKCGKYILLGNKSKAKESFEQISKEEQEAFRTYPIYKLYMEM